MSAELVVQKRPPRPLWWGFAPFILASAVHCAALFIGVEAIAGPTKLALMPALILAAIWGRPRLGNTAVFRLLLAGLFFSWLGDGAGTFFPFAPTLPMMLAFFAVAHLCYIRVFWRHLALRPLSRWALIFLLWWAVLLSILWPRAGSLAPAVAAYGLVLGTTAALSTRCSTMIMWGGAFFLASDTILAFRIFALELMPDWTSGMVMVTYTVGQGLIIAGALLTRRSSK